MGIIKAIYVLIRAFLLPRLIPAAENLAIRQQVALYQHSVNRPKLRNRDRVFWVWLSRLWANWQALAPSLDTTGWLLHQRNAPDFSPFLITSLAAHWLVPVQRR